MNWKWNTPADPGALDADRNLSFLETFAFLDRLETGLRLGDPEFVSRIGEDTNVGLGDGFCGRHN